MVPAPAGPEFLIGISDIPERKLFRNRIPSPGEETSRASEDAGDTENAAPDDAVTHDRFAEVPTAGGRIQT